jgi:molybdopterin-containing oxidoreductase family membrane subunit
VGLAYGIEFFSAMYSDDHHESFAFLNRARGPLGWGFAIMVAFNVIAPQLFWFKRVRTNLLAVFGISILVNVGMWFERFVIIVTSLQRDFLPSTWSEYVPTLVEIATLVGSFGLFFTCFLLFCRFLPVISMAEVKGVLAHVPSAVEPTQELSPSEIERLGRKAVVAAFASEHALLEAVAHVQKQGWPITDVHTPCPVHGLDQALGVRRSRLPMACFLCGLIGVSLALVFQFWSTAWNWPLNVGGQPWNSLPAFVPVMFECLVLFGGLGMVLAWLLRSGLYPGKLPSLPLQGETDNRFVLVLGPGLPVDGTEVLRSLRDHGAVTVREACDGQV